MSSRPIWTRLRKSRLQELIGTALLGRLEVVIPAVSPGNGLARDHLHSAETLARLFEAFVAGEKVRDPEFRKELLNTCRESELDELLVRLGRDPASVEGFSEKVAVVGAAPWTATGLAQHFVDVLGMSETLLPVEVEPVAAREEIQGAERPLKRLKDYQSTVFHEAKRHLEPPNGRLVLQMPTGSGKTRTAMELISWFMEGTVGKSRTVVWLAHSSELCHQAADAFMEVWPHYAHQRTHVLRCWGENRELPGESETDWFLVASLQMAHSLNQRQLLPKAELIVVDEAHKVLAPTYNAATRGLMAEGTRVLGLTATPGRGVDRSDENEALAEFFFNKKVSIDAEGESPIAFLRKRKVLAVLDREILQTGASVVASDEQAKAAQVQGDLPGSILNALGRNSLRSAEVARRLSQHAAEGRSCLVFATSVANSRFITALLSFMGVSAAHLDGSTRARDRVHIIEAFRDGEISVLCNFGVLTTGFDAPQIDVVCIARPTTSIVLYSQMLGRGLRGPAIGGTDRCRVIDVRDNIVGIPELEELYGYFDEYFSSGAVG